MTMQITLTGTQLCITFAYDAPTVAQVKTVNGTTWAKDARCWLAPVAALPTLITLFGHVAAFDYGALVAYDESRSRAARDLYDMLRSNGATFTVDESDVVIVEGDCISPLTAQVVADRSQWIRPYVEETGARASLGDADAISDAQAQKTPSGGVTGVQATREDRLLAKSIAGAVKAEERKQHHRREWWRKQEQASLFTQEE